MHYVSDIVTSDLANDSYMLSKEVRNHLSKTTIWSYLR